MQAIMEPIFEIAYLIIVIALGVWILRLSGGRKQYALFGVMAIVLGCGDAFHLVPRILANIGLHIPAALGFGTLVTSITMTVFYMFLYRIWQLRYKREKTKTLTMIVYGLAAVRVALCLFPQNQWLSADAPLRWGIYRNIPFLLLGIYIIALYGREVQRSDDSAFRYMPLAIALSFAFYVPVVLGADSIPALGMLMIPKTCAYVWIVWMGYADARRSARDGNSPDTA